MENIRDVLCEISILKDKIEQKFDRWTELDLIIAGCKMLEKDPTRYEIMLSFVKTEIEVMKKEIENLKAKEIVGIDGEVQ